MASYDSEDEKDLDDGEGMCIYHIRCKSSWCAGMSDVDCRLCTYCYIAKLVSIVACEMNYVLISYKV